MNFVVKSAGGPYWNKGKQCYWIELHDGTTHKFIVEPDAFEQDVSATLKVFGLPAVGGKYSGMPPVLPHETGPED